MTGGFVLGLALAALAAPSPARATFVDEGLTYTIFDNGSAGALGEAYTLQITGINQTGIGGDTVGGRISLESFAFGTPSGFVSATAPAGYTFMTGGLSSLGCDGSGGFFCFKENTLPTTVLAANTTLDLSFDVNPTLGALDACLGTAGGPDTCTDADLKVAWYGTANSAVGMFNGYDHLSENVGITPSSSSSSSSSSGVPILPEPGTLFILGVGLAGLALLRRYVLRA